MAHGVLIAIRESTDIAAARRHAMTIAHQAAFDGEQASNAGIVVTEAASNVLKHGGGGELLLHRDGQRIEIAAIDNGPGTASGARCFDDGYSTAGSAGTGLGAIRRLAEFVEFYSVSDAGSVLVAHIGNKGRDGAISIPYPGEQACGDAWSIQRTDDRTRILVADGLGHGVQASEAGRAVIETADRHRTLGAAALLEAAHGPLRTTRGAAASVADIAADGRTVEFAGVGNVTGLIAADALTRRQMISINGTLGHELRKVQQFKYSAQSNALVVLHSDGLSANWSFEKYPGLFGRHPSLIAAVLFRDFRRLRDDATVVVVRVGAERP